VPSERTSTAADVVVGGFCGALVGAALGFVGGYAFGQAEWRGLGAVGFAQLGAMVGFLVGAIGRPAAKRSDRRRSSRKEEGDDGTA